MHVWGEQKNLKSIIEKILLVHFREKKLKEDTYTIFLNFSIDLNFQTKNEVHFFSFCYLIIHTILFIFKFEILCL